MDNPVLYQAAKEYGIEPEYIDIWGHGHSTPEDVARAILASLGARGSDDQIARSIEQRHFDTWSRPLDPTLVVLEDADTVLLRIPAADSGTSINVEFRWEDGEVENHSFQQPELVTSETAHIRGTEYLAKRLPLPRPLRLGYHNVRVYSVRGPEPEVLCESKLIVCPRRAHGPDRRMAGVALSLYGLRSARNWGCGDFTDLIGVIDALAPTGAAFLALNPLHAIPNRQPYNTSPYLPECSLYRNFIYLDVEKVGQVEVDAAKIGALRASEFVEYEAVAKLKLAALTTVFDRFLQAGGSPEFDQYIASEGAPLEDFAVYCALDAEIHGRDPSIWLWTDWPVEYRDVRSPAVRQFAQEHKSQVLFYKFLQWHIDRQLAEAQAHACRSGMQIGLYHDLALATDRFGADLWANGPFYARGCRVGSPPDDFSPLGQDWSFPPPNRETHRADGYQLFAQSIRKNARHGGALRIDHVMRFFRLWWIPDNMPATSGAYVRDYAENLLRILALESVRGKFLVIGEDLGTVTDEVRRSLGESGILSHRVLWFQRNLGGTFLRPSEYPAQAAASTTTHDLPTLAGFGAGRDIEARRAAGLIDEKNYHEQLAHRQEESRRLNDALHEAGFPNDPIDFLLSTPCALAIINQEDLTGETEQQNLPGSTSQYPNWRRKMKIPVEEIGRLAEDLGRKIKTSGR